MKAARVKGVKTFDNKPVLNSLIYDVEFPDKTVREYAANIIAQNMYSSLSENGFSKLMLDCILEHSKDNSTVSKADKYLITKKGSVVFGKEQLAGKLF